MFGGVPRVVIDMHGVHAGAEGDAGLGPLCGHR